MEREIITPTSALLPSHCNRPLDHLDRTQQRLYSSKYLLQAQQLDCVPVRGTASPSSRAVRYVSGSSCTTTQIYAVSFALWIMRTTHTVQIEFI